MLIRFPQERVDYDTVQMDWGMPAEILILPMFPIMGMETARTVGESFAKLRKALEDV
jgi:hypothetical protein